MEYPSLPDIDTTMSYFNDVVDRIPFALGDLEKASPEASFARRFCVQREDMLEKMLITQRQANGLPVQSFSVNTMITQEGSKDGDAHFPSGTYSLGASPEDEFYLDNEKWGHGYFGGPCDVISFAAGDSGYGIRQMVGNV